LFVPLSPPLSLISQDALAEQKQQDAAVRNTRLYEQQQQHAAFMLAFDQDRAKARLQVREEEEKNAARVRPGPGQSAPAGERRRRKERGTDGCDDDMRVMPLMLPTRIPMIYRLCSNE